MVRIGFEAPCPESRDLLAKIFASGLSILEKHPLNFEIVRSKPCYPTFFIGGIVGELWTSKDVVIRGDDDAGYRRWNRSHKPQAFEGAEASSPLNVGPCGFQAHGVESASDSGK